jgi:hypothetical protein
MVLNVSTKQNAQTSPPLPLAQPTSTRPLVNVARAKFGHNAVVVVVLNIAVIQNLAYYVREIVEWVANARRALLEKTINV